MELYSKGGVQWNFTLKGGLQWNFTLKEVYNGTLL